MTVEVIVPAISIPDRLLRSISLGNRWPELVTLVTNEFEGKDFSTYGLPVRLIHFKSKRYRAGEYDVTLRRNIGIWEAKEPHLVFQDDDQNVHRTTIEESARQLEYQRIFWGHHRFIDFEEFATERLVMMDARHGRSREAGVNIKHGWQSCYAGMFGAHRDFIRDAGGFDMVFMGRFGSEDQQLGRRLCGERVMVLEPPFSWHPLKSPTRKARIPFPCDHELAPRAIGATMIQWCQKCPFYLAEGDLTAPRLILPYDARAVEIEIEYL